MILDSWQEEVLATTGNVVLRSGRQVGKSTIISIKAGEYAVKNRNKTILIIASVERQALLLFEKLLAYIYDNHKTYIKKGKDKPTKHTLKLINGSVIHCLPTGLSGYGIRGYTIDLLIADEAAFIPEEVWTAVTPMLAITKGNIVLLSTPFGKGGYFYRCFSDDSFTGFHVSSEDCPRKDPKFLDREKERMTHAQYAQEYLGEFVDELMQFFSSELITSVMRPRGSLLLSPSGDNFLGVDVARMGNDETVLFSLQLYKDKLRQLDLEISRKTYLTETIKRIKNADIRYKYNKIFIDDGGMGVGVFDPLLQDEQTRRKVVAINNSARSITRDAKRKKKLLKEDLYNNLLRIMEKREIELVEDADVMLSLKSIQYEYINGNLRISGNYSHITEALIRAAWCQKNKSLNIWIR